ncbi:MAG: bifunctional riboflavin kinase/FAD synthetase [Bacteroidetes bacterium]|nr:bifunctional riboflavin kinase/FAD synthetase [Bacteroidota bacterium]
MGFFDGIHIGHQEVIKNLIQNAKECGGTSVLITFFPHPRIVLFPEQSDLKLISTQEEKFQILEILGIDYVIEIPFTKEFSKLSAAEFVKQYLVDKIKTKKFIIGYDHRFGNNQEGNSHNLADLGKLYNFEVEEIPAKNISEIAVSSTKVRKALEIGNIKLANCYLGYNYSIKGTVIEGNRLGRTIGYPTANLSINNKYKLIPGNGVYAVLVEWNKKIYKGMLNIGTRPTLNLTGISIEVNIFDFDADIYNEVISISLIDRIRDEQKFNGLEELKLQLSQDQRKAIDILS